jgi:GxxExxY protein
MLTRKFIDDLSYKIIGCAIEVHRILGPGLLESIYEKCLIQELTLQKLSVRSQLKVPVNYKGINLQADLRLDLLVEELIVVEIKAVEALTLFMKLKL